jgi:hypothetical protein
VEEAVWGFVGVVVGGFLTAAVTLGAEVVRGRHEFGRDDAKRQTDRQLAHDDFQRETLLALTKDLDRAAGYCVHVDLPRSY